MQFLPAPPEQLIPDRAADSFDPVFTSRLNQQITGGAEGQTPHHVKHREAGLHFRDRRRQRGQVVEVVVPFFLSSPESGSIVNPPASWR